jgi:DNA replication protein DnaC
VSGGVSVTPDTPQILLEHHLKLLRLPTFLREYDKVARQCSTERVDYPRYLLRMSELELLDRERRATERRIHQARFPVIKSLDSFEFSAIPSLNKALVLELARCEFLTRRENVLLLGNSGTGKTHVALALGLAACQRGHRVRFATAAALVHELLEARDEKRLLRFQKQMASYELLIVDELGFVPLSKTGAELLFEVFSQRYERGSTLVTSNLLSGVDRSVRLRTINRSTAGPAHSPRTYPGDERRKLPPQTKQTKTEFLQQPNQIYTTQRLVQRRKE